MIRSACGVQSQAAAGFPRLLARNLSLAQARSSSAPLGSSSAYASMSRTPQANGLLPAQRARVALHLARGRESPPLRFAPDPGTPFLDQQTSIDVQVKGQIQSDE
jgi:hypothetical protein